jgi:hypothetical protein
MKEFAGFRLGLVRDDQIPALGYKPNVIPHNTPMDQLSCVARRRGTKEEQDDDDADHKTPATLRWYPIERMDPELLQRCRRYIVRNRDPNGPSVAEILDALFPPEWVSEMFKQVLEEF